MDEQRTPHLNKYLPLVVLTTLWVAVCPTFAVWLLRDTGVIASPVVSILVASALALAASYVGAAIWKTRPGAGDLLFSDLLIWGWLRRRRSERQLADAVGLLAGVDTAQEMSREQRQQMLVRLATSLEASDPHTHGHSRRVARQAAMIAKRMGLSRHEIDKVRTAAALHDIGKLDTPRTILQKQGRLTDDEFAVIKRHPVRSAELVAMLGDPELTSIVHHHHERIDGTGYPDGLMGEQIPLAARIVSVADVFDAITSTRPYRPARPHKEALDVLTKAAGTQLDVNAVRAFQSCYAGRRPLALWAMLTNLPEKLFIWLGSGANTVAGSVTGAIATSALASAVAVSAIASPLVSNPHLRPAAKPAYSATSAPISRPATPSTTRTQSALPALKPAPALISPLRRAPAPRGRRHAGSASAPPSAQSTTPHRPVTAAQSSPTTTSPASSGALAATGSGQAGASATTPSAGAGSPTPAQGTNTGGGHGSSSGSGQSNGNANGHGSGNATGQGNANATGQGNANAGGQGSGNGSASGQGSANSGGQGAGSATGQGSGSAGGQGAGNATGQGSGSGSGQGNGSANAGGQTSGNATPQASGTGQGQANGHANVAGPNATQN